MNSIDLLYNSYGLKVRQHFSPICLFKLPNLAI